METLAKLGMLVRHFPDTPRHRKQKYLSTDSINHIVIEHAGKSKGDAV
jgi:hypothetical protein